MAILTDTEKAAETEAATEAAADAAAKDSDILYPDANKTPEEIDAAEKEAEADGNKTEEQKTAEAKETEDKEAADKKTEEAKKIDDKQKTDEAGEIVPVKAEDLKFPDGIDEGIKGEYIETLNNKDMTPADKAQAFIDLQVKLNTEAYQKRSETWVNEVQSDPKFLGETGDKLEENLALAKIGMERLKVDGLSKYLVDSGEGNNPLFVEAFMKIGKATSEDTFHSSSSAGASKEAKTDAQVLYDGTKYT